MNEQLRRMECALNRMLIDQPFWAYLALRMQLIEASDEEVAAECGCATAFTDGKRIVGATKFFESLSNEQIGTLLAHEVLHPAMGHLWRTHPDWNRDVANQAADNEVNLMLEECNVAATSKGLPPPFPFPTGDSAPEMQRRFAGVAFENIYYQLMKEQKEGGGKGAQKPSGASKEGGKGQSGTPAPQKGANGKCGRKNGFGEFISPKVSRAKQQECKQDWEKAVLQAAMMAKQRGDLPAHFKRLVEQIVDPKAYWRDLTREFLRERSQDDYSWRKPNAKYLQTGMSLPILDGEKVGTVIFAVDTSGSISNDLLAQFKAEIQNCLDELAPEKVIVICCDADVQSVNEYVPGDTVGDAGRDFSGGGGTVFQPVWDYLQTKLEEPAVACIFLTDLYADFGKDPGIPVLWVTPTKGMQAPFGKTVETL